MHFVLRFVFEFAMMNSDQISENEEARSDHLQNITEEKNMKKTGILKKLIAVCLIAVLGATAIPATSYAKAPTIDTKAKVLTIGKNQLKYCNYDEYENTLLGCFTVPETGKYQFYITNNGEAFSKFSILDEDLAEIENSGPFCTIHPTEYVLFENYNLKKNQKIYFYIEADTAYRDELLAAKVDIQLVSTPKPAPKMSRSSISLKVHHKTTLKLKNNKKRVIWVSGNKKVATVSSKGVVKAKKKGTAYIYAIAGHKLYKCKVRTYK